MKRRFTPIAVLLLALFATTGWALSVTDIQSNPALLNTPMAQALMKEKGISPEQAKALLQKKLNASSTETPKKEGTLKQDIELPKKPKKPSKVSEPSIKSLAVSKYPLAYKSREALIAQAQKGRQSTLQAGGLKRFGFDFFANHNAINPDLTPVPDYYVLTPGDILLVHVFGSTNKDYTLKIDNYGNVNIPVIGPIHLGGMEFGQAKKELAQKIEKTFPGLKATVNIQKYATIQVTLTGEANAPGIYNLPSLSTIQSLLVQARGVAPTGSLRNIAVYRNGKLFRRVDLYGLLSGKPKETFFLRAGDVVHIGRSEKSVALYGEVKKPAVYELLPGENAGSLLNYAGGLKPEASREDIMIRRYTDHTVYRTFHLTLKELKRFPLEDGDALFVYPMDAAKEYDVFLFGNIVNPGPRAITSKTRTLRSLLIKETAKGLDGLFLPDTWFGYGFIKRRTPNLEEKLLSFAPMKVLNGEEDIELKKDDEIYFLNRYDVMSAPSVSIDGQVLKPGLYQYIDGMTLSDLVHAAGIDRLADDRVQITTYATPDHLPKTITVSLEKEGHYPLHAYDEVYLFDFYKTHPTAEVTISGEIVRPGRYAIDGNATLGKILRAAGGPTEKATTKGEIVRYEIVEGERKRMVFPFDLNKDANRKLQSYDKITLFRIPKWSEQQTVEIRGEVRYPGRYIIEEGETLSSVLERAGGFTDTAFVEGAVFTRESVKAMQRKQLERALNRLKKKAMVAVSQPTDFGTGQISATELITSIDALIQQAREAQPIGRITIQLDRDIRTFAKSGNDLVLKNGDTLFVPTKNDTVTVLGEVLNPTAMVYRDSYSPWDYIEKAGGLSDNANDETIYIVHANGEAEKLESGLFVINTPKIRPGDTIVVPLYIRSYSNLQIARDATQIVYQLAVGIAALSSIGVF